MGILLSLCGNVPIWYGLVLVRCAINEPTLQTHIESSIIIGSEAKSQSVKTESLMPKQMLHLVRWLLCFLRELISLFVYPFTPVSRALGKGACMCVGVFACVFLEDLRSLSSAAPLPDKREHMTACLSSNPLQKAIRTGCARETPWPPALLCTSGCYFVGRYLATCPPVNRCLSCSSPFFCSGPTDLLNKGAQTNGFIRVWVARDPRCCVTSQCERTKSNVREQVMNRGAATESLYFVDLTRSCFVNSVFERVPTSVV